MGKKDKGQQNNFHIFKKALIFAALFVLFAMPFADASASLLDEKRSELENLKEKIERYEDKAKQYDQKADTLESQIGSMRNKIQTLESRIEYNNKKIEKTNLTIKDLNTQIEKKEKELEHQEKVLGQAIKYMYEEGETPFLETFFSSNTFSEALDRTEYLNTAERKIENTISKIEGLKSELKNKRKKQRQKRKELKQIKKDLSSQRSALSYQKSAKSNLLAETKQSEEKYKEYTKKVEAELRKVQQQISNLITSGDFVSQGHVEQGDVIGYMGSTGFSSGAHLHFGVYRNNGGNFGTGDVDPMIYLNNGQLSWPFNSYYITQGYWGSYSHRGRGWPGGVDLVATSGYGAPVRAAAAGDIIRNQRLSYGFGHYVVISHGDGLFSLYAHLK